MKPTDTSEKALEQLIVRHLAGISEHPPVPANTVQQPQAVYAPGGYVLGRASDYNRDVALDVVQLLAFLQATNPRAMDTLELAAEGIKRTQFLHRLQGEITKRGVVDVLRKGACTGARRSSSPQCRSFRSSLRSWATSRASASRC